MKLSSFKWRIRVVAICILLISTILIGRLFLVQVVNKEKYADRADRQYITSASNIFNRGSIFFSKKDGSLFTGASVVTGFKLAMNPKEIVDEKDIYNKLKSYIKFDEQTFVSKALKKNDPYEEIATNLSKEQVAQIEEMKIKGISIYKDNWRSYPSNDMASHTIGFLAYKGDSLIGQYGLERYYENVLSKPKEESYVNFFAEVFMNIKDTISNSKKGDIVTTLEPLVQDTLDESLKSIMSKWSAEQAGGIIMNPQTGEIYAISGMPDFNLNDFKNVSNVGVYRNPIVENVFEFGSVIKPLVMAAGIDKGVVNPSTTYTDNGSIVVDGKTINNFDKKGRGLATMQTVLDQSLNTGMVFVESRLGHANFRTYMKSYGIGDKTGIDLPNETSGLIKNLESPRNLEYANASFGQGIALTPIEAVRAFSVLANGGKIITPHLVNRIDYDDGTSETLSYPIVKEGLLKKETTDTITKMLIHVFESYDQGSHKISTHSIATKTGTAQVAQENGKGYYLDKHTHSFFGYFPAYDPKFIVFLFVKDPRGVRYASQTLIPPFVEITKFILNYYNVPPDR